LVCGSSSVLNLRKRNPQLTALKGTFQVYHSLELGELRCFTTQGRDQCLSLLYFVTSASAVSFLPCSGVHELSAPLHSGPGPPRAGRSTRSPRVLNECVISGFSDPVVCFPLPLPSCHPPRSAARPPPSVFVGNATASAYALQTGGPQILKPRRVASMLFPVGPRRSRVPARAVRGLVTTWGTYLRCSAELTVAWLLLRVMVCGVHSRWAGSGGERSSRNVEARRTRRVLPTERLSVSNTESMSCNAQPSSPLQAPDSYAFPVLPKVTSHRGSRGEGGVSLCGWHPRLRCSLPAPVRS